jgi:hypothetical protein
MARQRRTADNTFRFSVLSQSSSVSSSKGFHRVNADIVDKNVQRVLPLRKGGKLGGAGAVDRSATHTLHLAGSGEVGHGSIVSSSRRPVDDHAGPSARNAGAVSLPMPEWSR